MERLEAALQKARQERQQPRPEAEPGASPADLPAADGSPWEMLREGRITPRWGRRNRIVALNQGRESAAYDLLRSRTLRIMGENGWKRLAITSPNKTCGKTTVTANLAFSLSRQLDLRILALDFDLRRPALHRLLGHRPAHSLHEVLAGERPFEDAFIRFGSNLAFGLNRAPARNPSELLQSKRARQKLDELQRIFRPDLILFDMPPMLASDENIGFLPAVDCALLIGAADSTTISQLDICEKELADLTGVLGIVLNKCRFTDTDSGYDYEYY